MKNYQFFRKKENYMWKNLTNLQSTLKISFKNITKKVMLIILVVLTTIQLAILVGWIINPWIKQQPFPILIQTETRILRVLTPLSPYLLLTGIYFWLTKPLNQKIKAFKKLKEKIEKFKTYNLPTKKSALIVLVATILALTLALYPYHPNLNPDGKPIGVDVKHYVKYLREIITQPTITQAINQAFTETAEGQRGIHLTILYLVALLTETNIVNVAKFQLPFLIIFILLAIYPLTLEGYKNRLYASILTLFTASSHLLTIGVFAAFYSNLFALAFCYLYYTFLLKYSTQPSKKIFLAMLLTSTPTIFIHPWTWIMLILGVTFIYLLLQISRKNFSPKIKKKILPITLILAINITIDFVVKSIIFQATTGEIVAYKTLSTGLSLANLENFFTNLFMATRIFAGGAYSNPLILTLLILGVFSLNFQKNNYTQLILAWILAVSLIFPFSNSSIQSRLIFNLPLPILAVEGLFLLGTIIQKNKNSKLKTEVKLLFLLLTLTSFSYAFRYIINTIPILT